MTLFERIVAREIPADIVYEDESVIAFRDIHPQAPTHVLVCPKRCIAKLSDAEPADRELLGDVLLAVGKVARAAGLEHYRVAINNGAGAGQSVFHLHLHLLGGRAMSWPPG
jgi:histidine triad (HIT) family protein